MHFIKLFILLLFCSISSAIFSQNYGRVPNQEFGIHLGVANYMGDLSSADGLIKGLQARAFRPAGGIFYRNNFTRFSSFRSSLTIGQVMGDDRWAADPDLRQRNLHFKSNITEVNIMFEWNILPYYIGHYKYKFTPFIGLGVGGFMFNPKAELDGRWVALQPLGTEGQGLIEYPDRTKYSKIAVSIPFSFGLKWNIGDYIAMGVELQYRLLFTDYLDDVSTVYPNLSYYNNNYVDALATEAAALSYREIGGNPDNIEGRIRGNPDDNDTYFFIMLKASYSIGRGSGSCPTFK